MANVLVLKSSINGETSLTNQLINEFLAARQAAGHGDRLTEHDLSAMALPTLDRPLFAALRGAVDPQPAIREAVALSDQLIAELKASDLLVIGAPMYNLNVPTDLKKWFDLVARARETFATPRAGRRGWWRASGRWSSAAAAVFTREKLPTPSRPICARYWG